MPPTSLRSQRAIPLPRPTEQPSGHGLRNTILAALGAVVAFVLGGATVLLWQGHTRTSSAPTVPAELASAAGVQKAANTYFAFYAAGQYATTYTLLSPSARATISEATWDGAHQACVDHSTQLAYSVTQPVVSGGTAVVRVSVQGALSKLGSEEASFTYSGGRWWYLPPSMSVYQGHTTAQAVAALKAASQCS